MSARQSLLFCISASLLAASSGALAGPLPKVSFVHPGLIEGYCSAVSPAKPDAAVLAEIDAMMPQFAAAWAADGPGLMGGTVELTGRPYLFAETLATVHGCPDLPSFSMPLLIAGARYTKAWAALPGPREATVGIGGTRIQVQEPRVVSPMSHFTNLVWHEIAHRYINDIVKQLPGATTPLLMRYSADPPVVRNHLHLFALDQLLYRRLGRGAEHRRRREVLSESSPGLYGRAFEILDREGAQRFVDELKK